MKATQRRDSGHTPTCTSTNNRRKKEGKQKRQSTPLAYTEPAPPDDHESGVAACLPTAEPAARMPGGNEKSPLPLDDGPGERDADDDDGGALGSK